MAIPTGSRSNSVRDSIKNMNKTETPKGTGSRRASERQKRSSSAAARQGKECVTVEGEHQRELERLTQVISLADMRKGRARENLMAAETVHRVLKEAYKKEAAAWVKACIKKGLFLL